jgi:hypothetical protein
MRAFGKQIHSVNSGTNTLFIGHNSQGNGQHTTTDDCGDNNNITEDGTEPPTNFVTPLMIAIGNYGITCGWLER